MSKEHTRHVPVLLNEVLQFLQPRPGGRYIDGTLGGAGHASAILERSAPDGRVLGIDTDTMALKRAEALLPDEVQHQRLILAHGNFADLAHIAGRFGFISIDGILLDLGFSSDQMDDPQRGFSFSADGPLDMRLDTSLDVSAADIVNEASAPELADIFWRYGEEARSRAVARRIVQARTRGAITRTSQLASLVAAGVPHKPGAIHPATRVFQALRIAVNHELEHLKAALPQMLDLLSRGGERGAVGEGTGRLAIISFHSLEDRIVKEFIRSESKDCLCPPQVPICVCGHKARLRILTPKPVTPSEQEIQTNPRARSAKLRAAEMIVSS